MMLLLIISALPYNLIFFYYYFVKKKKKLLFAIYDLLLPFFGGRGRGWRCSSVVKFLPDSIFITIAERIL